MSDSERDIGEPVTDFVPYPAIGSMTSTKKLADRHMLKEKRVGPIEYRGKVREPWTFSFENIILTNWAIQVKLHGTNGGIQIYPDGRVQPQSRNRPLYKTGHDNAGFGAWVFTNEEYFAGLADDKVTVVVFGEWCGKDIRQNVAIRFD